jgi:hypothetical protein
VLHLYAKQKIKKQECYTEDMKKIDDKMTITELTEMAEKMYGSLVKGVVDLQRHVLIVDAEMHADEEQLLLEDGSQQQDLWGINLYPAKFGTDEFIEFDSMINIRPRQHNMSRGVEDEDIRKQIVALVSEKVGSA